MSLHRFGEVVSFEYKSLESNSVTQRVNLTDATLTTDKGEVFTIPWMRLDAIEYTAKKIKGKTVGFHQMRLPSMSITPQMKPGTTYIITHINNICMKFYAVVNDVCIISGYTNKEDWNGIYNFEENVLNTTTSTSTNTTDKKEGILKSLLHKYFLRFV